MVNFFTVFSRAHVFAVGGPLGRTLQKCLQLLFFSPCTATLFELLIIPVHKEFLQKWLHVVIQLYIDA